MDDADECEDEFECHYPDGECECHCFCGNAIGESQWVVKIGCAQMIHGLCEECAKEDGGEYSWQEDGVEDAN